jgi:hypothetical protein
MPYPGNVLDVLLSNFATSAVVLLGIGPTLRKANNFVESRLGKQHSSRSVGRLTRYLRPSAICARSGGITILRGKPLSNLHFCRAERCDIGIREE